MVGQPLPLQTAIAQFDRLALRPALEKSERQRRSVIERFPLENWPTLTLERYALGQNDSEDTFCRWLEFRTPTIASMRGGSARKLIIYKHRNRPGWHFPKDYRDEGEAWRAVRAGFVEAFAKAKSGEWGTIDDIVALEGGQALRTKALYIYFPEDLLPVCSHAHIKHFLQLIKPDAVQSSFGVVRLNRALLSAMRAIAELRDWTNREIAALLYSWADPRDGRRVVKIAPGEDAKYWDDCLEGSYICVGWDNVGDLSEFDSKEPFLEAFRREYGQRYKANKLTEKANEVWTLHDLAPGDIVVANKGTSRVLAVGEVIEPGYQFRPDRPEYCHTVSIKWDTSVAADIPPQKNWAFVTVAKVPTDLYESIVKRRLGPSPAPVDPFYEEIAAALERKGQVILYGPPGTGKTYSARRFAVWWLLRKGNNSGTAAIHGDPLRFRQVEQSLSTVQVRQRVWWIVANPKEWSWDRLRKEKIVEYRYGRLQRNYALVQPGDLVIGYQSTPDKRIVALAKISRGLEKAGKDDPTIELAYLHDVKNGMTYEELLDDKLLATSEPMRFRNQGTLFALDPDQAGHALAVLAEKDPSAAQFLQDEGRVGQLTRLTFHPSYSYEDFVEGFRPVESGGGGLTLRLEDGVFKRVCREAQAHPDQPYLVMIDEVNRANIAKVFGELITLLEIDKRDMIVTLPQSKESFAIPSNVFVLGTMNTADRSIKLLDAALRRRFAFLELMPNIELLRGGRIEGLDLDEFLEELNTRIAKHVGREKQIGHSFLLDNGQPISDADEFARRFRQEILPLLQEYCYDDYTALQRYLGPKMIDPATQTLRHEILDDAEALLEALQSEFAESPEANPS